MKNPRLIDLQIKIASLTAQSRIIRDKENDLKFKAYLLRSKSIATHKGLKVGPTVEMPDDLAELCVARVKQNCERLFKEKQYAKAETALITTTRKTIRKWLRAGLTKEQILAMPGVQKALQYSAKLDDLHKHRTQTVRPESRHSQLAYAFLRGKAYSRTEDKAKNLPNWDYVQRIAERFSGEDKRVIAQRFEQWRQEAALVLKGNELMRMKTANKLAA